MGEWKRTRVPSVENIYLDLLRGSLDCGDFIVRNEFPEVVIADLSLVAFANEQTRLGLQGIDVVFQLYREIQIYADQNHAVAHLIPERDGIRSVGRRFDHSRELCLRYTRDELRESESFIIGKIGQRLDIVNDELSDDRGPTVRK